MNLAKTKREKLVEMLADHVLAHGLHTASLRPLAAAAGTSDRMLLHYFSDKADLLTAVLMRVSERLQALLHEAGLEPQPVDRLLPLLGSLLNDARVRPYLQLWLELAARATHDELSRSIAKQIMSGFHRWMASLLIVRREDERESQASLVLATLEGLVLLDTLGMSSTVKSALEGYSTVMRRPKDRAPRRKK